MIEDKDKDKDSGTDEGHRSRGCSLGCLVPAAAVAVLVALAAYGLGFDPRTAAGVGALSGLGVLIGPSLVMLSIVGLLLAVVGGAVVLAILFVLVDAWVGPGNRLGR